ncbi:hypothetical protein BC937DRAFT_91629 [Endogone sp. FLAS-F59071]|nr:hypothetical protein BC937DRAFT_91629 [Endogone sp. FLAS-F59071]|eukprot:RUS16076.1 hypothetical protein BC937DRAFT_91629 [Endogone sp. FLAS-F59071]
MATDAYSCAVEAAWCAKIISRTVSRRVAAFCWRHSEPHWREEKVMFAHFILECDLEAKGENLANLGSLPGNILSSLTAHMKCDNRSPRRPVPYIA